jgi:hypothetical protein
MSVRTKRSTEEPRDIEDILDKYLDPDNELQSMLFENKLIVNSTQVSRANIDGLIKSLGPLGLTVIVVDYHPSQYTESAIYKLVDKNNNLIMPLKDLTDPQLDALISIIRDWEKNL